MGHIVINCYRPKAGKTERLVGLIQRHLAVLRNRGLATARPSITMTASDGTVVEIFEWASKDAMARAEGDADLDGMAREYHEVCERVPLAELHEAGRLLAEFEAVG